MTKLPPELNVMIDKMLAVQISAPEQSDETLEATAAEHIATCPVEAQRAVDFLVNNWKLDSPNYAAIAAVQLLRVAGSVAKDFVPDPVTPIVDRLVADPDKGWGPDPTDHAHMMSAGRRWLTMINTFNNLIVSMVGNMLLVQTEADRQRVYAQTVTEIANLARAYGVQPSRRMPEPSALAASPHHRGQHATVT